MMAGNMAAISNQEAINMTMKANMLRAPEKKIEDLVSGSDFGLPRLPSPGSTYRLLLCETNTLCV